MHEDTTALIFSQFKITLPGEQTRQAIVSNFSTQFKIMGAYKRGILWVYYKLLDLCIANAPTLEN